MSGYPLKNEYDAKKKRNKYLEELKLRAHLDDVILQAVKVYERTGAIATLPDTRTTTEKLSDLYRLRIDIFDKLKEIMSGDDSQKVVNDLDEDEIQFLSQRLDGMIKYLKPKYKLGVPYQVFNDYFLKSLQAFNELGDDNIGTLVLLENMVSKDDFESALNSMAKMYSTSEQKKIKGLMQFYSSLSNDIMQAQRLISSGVQIDPITQSDISTIISNIQPNIPSNNDIKQILTKYEMALSYNDTQTIDALKLEIDGLLANVASLQREKDELQRSIEDAVRQNKIEQVSYEMQPAQQQQPITQTQTLYKTENGYTYIPPSEINNYKRSSMYDNNLGDYIIISYNLLGDDNRWKYEGGASPDSTMKTNWKVGQLKKWIVDNDALFQEIWKSDTVSLIPPLLPTPQPTPPPTPIQLILTPTPTPTPPVRQPTPPTIRPTLPDKISIKNIAKSANMTTSQLKQMIESANSSGDLDFVKNKVREIIDLPNTQTYQTTLKSLDEIYAYIVDWVSALARDETLVLSDYIDDRVIQGTGLKKKKGSKSRMKGKGVMIDMNAGIQSNGEKPSHYVPFGKFIINRTKLGSGIVMIKRPNGAFMGDIQSKRVSNKLKNVFDKILGGNIPSFSDYESLDDDEREYLKYVSSKANIDDKLSVPTPKKDDAEKLINKYEIYRGMLIAGQDNKQMVEDFKKLLVELCDKKLLPRRQVSDILIDLARLY